MEDQLDEEKLENMIWDVGVEAFVYVHVYETMFTHVETLLYVSSTMFTRLSTVLRQININMTNGWMDKSFTKLLVLLNERLLDGNTLHTCNYDDKKILCLIGMEYKRIHACPNDFII